MKERESKPAEKMGTTSLAIDAVAEALKVPAQEQWDVTLGIGHRFTLPEGGGNTAGELVIYPERRLIRYRNPLLQLDLANVTAVKAQGKLVQVECRDQTSRSVFFLQPNGTFTLSAIGLSTARKATVEGEQQENPPGVPSTVPEPGLPKAAPAAGPDQQPEPTPPGPAQPEKPERVVFTGRVGRVPQVRETPSKRLIARMPLAVHEGEKTVWHNILFFDEKARKAAEELTKGEVVTVVGYKHTREVPTKYGMKQVEQIFAAAVRTPKTDQKSGTVPSDSNKGVTR